MKFMNNSVRGRGASCLTFCVFLAIMMAMNSCSNEQQEQLEEPVEVGDASAAGAAKDGAGGAATGDEAAVVEGSSEGSPDAATSVEAVEATPSSPVPGQGSTASSSRRVMYVKVDGAVLRDSPDASGQVASKLSKGDHMLVTIEGDWARTDSGKFISMKSLSEKGVGKKKSKPRWSGGN